MQNVESAMEKGEAGWVGTLESPAAPSPVPTTSTLCNSGTEKSTASNSALLTPENSSSNTQRKWPSWNIFCGGRRHKKYRVPVNTRRLNDHCRGYPNLAAFLDSDEGFTIYRRFGYIQSRLLLRKQDELRVLEEKLQKTDLSIAAKDDNALCSRTIHGSCGEEQRKLFSDLESTFYSYAKLLQTAQQMMSFNKPSDSEYESVGRYIENRKPMKGKQATWIQHKEDIITLRAGREHAWLDEVIEGFLKYCHCKLIDKIFRSEETRKKTEINGIMPGQPPKDEDKYELYYTPSRIAKLANGILTILVLLLLILPIYILYHMIHDVGTHRAYLISIGCLLVFTLAFSSVLSVFTKAKRHEILAAAAAYCAVLVVFLGNVVPG